MTPIEDTVPEVPDDVDATELAEIVDELTTMNSDDWSTIAENGTAGSAQLEFAFSAPNEDAAVLLLEDVRDELGYTATATEPQGELDDWTVRGTTCEVAVTESGLAEWVRRVAAFGLEHEGVLDGWAVLLD